MLTYVFQTCGNLAKSLFAEHKKTRVPGEPRDFVDCYLDELDKVCVCLFVNWKNEWTSMLLTFSCSDGDRIANEQCLLTLSFSCRPAKRENDDSSFSEDQLCAFLLDLHFAGTDTTANTILSALLYLMNYPQIQGMSTSHLSVTTLFIHASGKVSPPDWTISTILNGLTGSNVVDIRGSQMMHPNVQFISRQKI